jgi:hypothetical protein
VIFLFVLLREKNSLVSPEGLIIYFRLIFSPFSSLLFAICPGTEQF